MRRICSTDGIPLNNRRSRREPNEQRSNVDWKDCSLTTTSSTTSNTANSSSNSSARNSLRVVIGVTSQTTTNNNNLFFPRNQSSSSLYVVRARQSISLSPSTSTDSPTQQSLANHDFNSSTTRTSSRPSLPQISPNNNRSYNPLLLLSSSSSDKKISNSSITTVTKADKASSSIARRTLTQLMTIPSNRSCADCKVALLDLSQVYVSISPIIKPHRQQYRSSQIASIKSIQSIQHNSKFHPISDEHLAKSEDKNTELLYPSLDDTNRKEELQQQLRHGRESNGSDNSTTFIPQNKHDHKTENEGSPHISPIDPALLASLYIGGVGVFVCSMCGTVHKQLGTEFTTVIAAQDTANWTAANVQILVGAGGGNVRSNAILERFLTPNQEAQIRPTASSSISTRLSFVRAKYQALAFVLPPPIGPFVSQAWRNIVTINYPAIWGNRAPWVTTLVLSSLDPFTGLHHIAHPCYNPALTSPENSIHTGHNYNSNSNISNNSKNSNSKTDISHTSTNARPTLHNANVKYRERDDVPSSDSAIELEEGVISRSRSSELPDRLVDYFCVITASQHLEAKFLNDQRGFRMKKQPKSPEDVLLQPVVTDCFPTHGNSKTNNSIHNQHDFEFPEHVATFVFPEGCKPSKAQLPPAFYTFVLTDASGDRLYGAVLRIYDDVRDIAWLRQAFLNHPVEWGDVLPTWMLPEVSDKKHGNNHHRNETSPTEKTEIDILEQSLGSTGHKRADSDSSVPTNHMDSQTFKFHTIASLNLPEGVELMHESGSLEQQRHEDPSLLRMNCSIHSSSDVLFLPKCLVVLSHHPFFDLYRKFLLQLYRITLMEAPLPIERFIANFVREVPLPPPGKVQVKFGFTLHDAWIIERPPENELPMSNFSYLPLFTTLSIPNILTIFGCLLQECRVALVSEHYALLGPTAEALLSLLFPFHWQGMYLPLMPYNMLDILDAPVPYLVGLHSRYLAEVAPDDRPKGVVFVDLDKDVVHLGYEEHDYKKIPRQPPCFPERQIMKLKSKLIEYASCVYIPPTSHHSRRRMYRSSTMTVGDGQIHEPVEDDETNNTESSTLSKTFDNGNDQQKYHKSSTRQDVLAKTSKAYSDNELLTPITGFLSEQGQFSGYDINKDQRDISKNNTSSKKFAFLPSSRMPRQYHKQLSSMSLENHNKNDNCNISHDYSNINLLDVEEPSGFETMEIRYAFLRFFVSVLGKYRNYIDEDSIHFKFRAADFLTFVTNNGSAQAVQFFYSLFQTQMFNTFIDERIHFPNDSEVLFFDESIIEKQNRSTKKALTNISKGRNLKKQTSFLHDTKSKVTNVFTPPSPSNWGLPDDGRTYCYSSFPKLEPHLFGKLRPPMNWSHSTPSNNTSLRNLRRPAAKTSQHEQAFLRKALLLPQTTTQLVVQSMAKVGARNLDSAINVISSPFGSNRTTISKAFNDDNKVRQRWRGLGSDDSISITLDGDTDNIVERDDIYWNARRKQAILIGIIIKFQSYCRMQLLLHQRRDLMIRNTIQQQMVTLSSGVFQTLRRQNAVIAIQSLFRSKRHRTAYVRIRKFIIKMQSQLRGRRVHLAFVLLIGIVSRFQAVVRGHLIRQVVTTVISKRMQFYRSHIFALWIDSKTPLSFRAKFWPILQSTRFLQLALTERELIRLWELLNLKDYTNQLISNHLAGDELVLSNREHQLGLCNRCYFRAIKIHSLLTVQRVSETSVCPKTKSTLMEVVQSLHTTKRDDRVEVEHDDQLHVVRIIAERLQIYERLSCNLSENFLEQWCQKFRIEDKKKHRKLALAETIWSELGNADESAHFMLIVFPELIKSCDITFLPPSKKGLRLFGISSFITPSPLPPFLSIDTIIRDRIQKNVVEVASLALTKIPILLTKLSSNKRRTWSKTYSTRLKTIQSLYSLESPEKAGYFIMMQNFKSI